MPLVEGVEHEHGRCCFRAQGVGVGVGVGDVDIWNEGHFRLLVLGSEGIKTAQEPTQQT